MPRDEDEDLSAPLELGPDPPSPPRGKPSAARPAKPVVSAAPAPPRPATRGVGPARAAPPPRGGGGGGVAPQCGGLPAFPGSTETTRFASSGVGYPAPPIQTKWRAVPSEPGRYELPWEGDPGAV